MDLDCEPLRILVTSASAQLVVRLIGELDLSCVEPLRQVTDLDLGAVRSITVDLGELEFIDSTGIDSLLKFKVAHEDANRTVSFVSPQPFVKRIFLVLGLGAYLEG